MKKLTLLILPLAALALAACGQKTTTPPGGQNPPTDKLYTKMGVVGYSRTGVSAKFITAASPVNLTDLKGSSTLDTCQLGLPPANVGSSNLLKILTSNDKGMDAGDTLTFRKNGAAFATLLRMDTKPPATGYSYTANTLVLSGLNALTLSIPGAAGGFPAFADVPFPVPNSAFKLTTPTNLKAAVTATTQFSWEGASNTADGEVLIYVSYGDQYQSTFYCVARDDGSFSIPSDFKDVLKAQNFTTGKAAVFQTITQFKTSGDALLVLQSLSSVQ